MSNETKFNYFPNHGDDEGRKSWTIAYGLEEDDDYQIVTAVDTKKEAILTCRALNNILKQRQKEKRELKKEARELMIQLLPGEDYGESFEAERLEEIINTL